MATPAKPLHKLPLNAAAANSKPAAPATPLPSTLWKCEVSGVPEPGLTVGAKFGLKCEGAEVQDFNASAFSLELAKPDKYRLRILENKKSTTSGVDLVVTSYVPGDTSLKDAVLTDGQNRIALDGVNFMVKSVIKEGAQEPKPFPAEVPVGMMWPMSVIVAIVLVVMVILVGVIALVQRRQRRAKFAAWLVANRTPLSPFDQLNKELRKSLKERLPVQHLQELETATQTYLSRLYEASLMTRSPRAIVKVIAGSDKKARKVLLPITIRLFGEFERVSERLLKSQLDQTEALNVVLPQIHELIREFAEKVQAEFAKKKGRR